MSMIIRIYAFSKTKSSSLSKILQGIRVNLRSEKNLICLRSRRSLQLCAGFLGLSLANDKSNNAIKNVETMAQIIKKVKARPVKKGVIQSLILDLYEFICIALRAFRLGVTFIPIALLYPMTYCGTYFEKTWWRLLTSGMESCGPIFIKLGQWASTRRDLFPDACCNQFARLQRRTKCHPWEYTKKILRRSFGGNWRKIFVKIDNNREPIGSGCVAQVYKVWISPDHVLDADVLEDFTTENEDNEDYSIFMSDAIWTLNITKMMMGSFAKLIWNVVGFISLEVLGFGNYFNPAQREDFEQNEAFMEWRNYRNEKRAAMVAASLKDRSKDVSFQSIESVAGELAEELSTSNGSQQDAPPPSQGELDSSPQRGDLDGGEGEVKQVDHFLAEQWLESLDAYEKSLPIETNNSDALEGLVPVAIKVLHPGVQTLFRRDMAILKFSTTLISWLVPPLKWLALPQCIEEFSRVMSAQIDMREEAKNLEKFIEFFAGVDTVRFPRPLLPLVTQRVLVESFEEGEPITNIIASSDLELLKQNLANIGVDALLKMVFVDNFSHGDLHPGNVLVQNITFDENRNFKCQDGNTSKIMMVDIGTDIFVMDVVPDPNPLRICLLDCGVVTSLKEEDLQMFKSVMAEVVKGNGDSVAELFLKHSEHKCSNTVAFKKDMTNLIRDARANVRALEKVDVGNLLHDVLSLLVRHRVRLESSFGSVIISMIVLEGLGRALDPQLDLLSKASPYLIR